MELVLLMRTGNTSAPVIWASRCTVSAAASSTNRSSSSPFRHREHGIDSSSGVCRPGTGIYNFGVLPTEVPVPVSTLPGARGVQCDWSVPQPTNIPDSHTRTCAAVLPDGRRWLVGAQLPKVSELRAIDDETTMMCMPCHTDTPHSIRYVCIGRSARTADAITVERRPRLGQGMAVE